MHEKMVSFLGIAMLLLADDPTGESLRTLHTDNWARTWAMGKIELEGVYLIPLTLNDK